MPGPRLPIRRAGVLLARKLLNDGFIDPGIVQAGGRADWAIIRDGSKAIGGRLRSALRFSEVQPPS
jgi:hypothetical protein